jgi:hypothetical protein
MMQTYMKELSHLGPVGSLFGGLGKRWLLIAGCWMLTVASTWGQNASLEVMGSLEHEESKSTLVNATVRVLQAGEPFDQVEVDRNGRYFLDLPLRGDYMLVFESEGTIAKRVQVDGTVIPEDMGLDGFRLELDMALFDEMDGFDESILETPIGIAVFDIDSEKIEFDLRHTAEMRRKIDKELDRLADAADDQRRNQMRYENAIEDAERAVARKRWDDAKLEYEKALKFLPGDAAAVAGLAQVQGELDAIAAAEAAERQAELDAAKAEEDERLAAEASERLEAEAVAAEAAAQRPASPPSNWLPKKPSVWPLKKRNVSQRKKRRWKWSKKKPKRHGRHPSWKTLNRIQRQTTTQPKTPHFKRSKMP